MSQDGETLWNVFLIVAARDAEALDSGVGGMRPDLLAEDAGSRLDELALHAFRLASQSLLMGAEELGQLALACERALDLLADGSMVPEHGLPILAASTLTLRQAVTRLASSHAADRSGARVDPRPLEAARYELETLFPVPGRRGPGSPDVPLSALTRRPGERAADQSPGSIVPGGIPPGIPPAMSLAGEPTPAGAEPAGAAWQPDVDEDMVELFFEEAEERIEDLAIKLLDVEKRPGDGELLRDVFRDLHTLKGSSAMVALGPMNRLAHAAEDLVGQLRDGDRDVDGAIIDAMLAALDGLRDILALAKRGRIIDADLGPILRRLRDPHAAGPNAGADAEDAALAPDATASHAAATEAGDTDDPGAKLSAASRSASRQTIRVDFDKLDRLMNLVGELVLGRDRLHGAIESLGSMSSELSSDRQLTRRLSSARRTATGGGKGNARDAFRQLGDEIGRIERVLVDISQDLDYATGRLDSVSDELRDQVMKLRMVPIGGVFRKYHRIVRDLAGALGKRVSLELHGEDTELDKLLVEALDEPLMHLVRNAVDHGVEQPEERIAAGKSAEGRMRLSATHRGNQVVIEIADDGKGIDPAFLRRRARERDLLTPAELDTLDDHQILDIIFRPGFSTAATVSQVSGRGVGMDVVRQTIVRRLKGTIDIDSALGRGTRFTLRLPLTLAIIQVLLARAGGEVLAVPLDSVLRTTSRLPDQVQLIQEREVIAMRGRQVPLIRVARVLELGPAYDRHALLHVILTEVSGELYGLACDHLLGKKEIVIKSLGDMLENVPCAAGATLLGDRCALILDVPAVVQRALSLDPEPAITAHLAAPTAPRSADQAAPRILVVEDSEVVREALARLLRDAGFRCTLASDGVEGLAAARREVFDLVSTDVMMPRMDGYELTRALRALPAYRDIPIIMVTSRGERIDRVRGFDAGVDEYITKPHDRQLYLRAIRKLLHGGHGGHGPGGVAPGEDPR